MNKTLNAILMSVSALTAAAPAAAEEAPFIDRTDFKTATGVFDIDALEALGRVSDPRVSPDGKTVLFGISYESLEQNASNNDLYTLALDARDAQPVRITRTPKSEAGAVWMADGRIAFLYPDADGKMQMWTMKADGADRVQATTHEGGISGFLLSPDEKHVVVIGNVKYARNAADIYPDLPKATGHVVDDLMYKHWDEWVTEIPHPFAGSFDGTAVKDLRDIMQDEPYEAPMKPFGGVESFAWQDARVRVPQEDGHGLRPLHQLRPVPL